MKTQLQIKIGTRTVEHTVFGHVQAKVSQSTMFSKPSKRTVNNALDFFLFISMASVFTYMSWSHVDKYLKKHVGQITQPRVPERNHFPTTIICRKNAYDENKVIQSGLPKDFYSRFSLPENLSTDFPDLNTKWNDVTMGIGHTLRVVAYRDHL